MLADAIAVYRLTRLVTEDELTKPLRARIIEQAYVRCGRRGEVVAEFGPVDHVDAWDDIVKLDDDPPKIATLVTCRWCAGMWLAAFVVLARRVAPRAWEPLRDTLAFSAAAALLARAEDD